MHAMYIGSLFFLCLVVNSDPPFAFANERKVTRSPLVEQKATSRSGEKRRRETVTFSLLLGIGSSGPANDIEELMIVGGFDQRSRSARGITYPFSVTGVNVETGTSWLAHLHYALSPTFGAGIILSNTEFGATHGRTGSADIMMSYSGLTLATILTLQPIKNIRLGFGPAFYDPKVKSSAFRIESDGKSTFGFLAHLGIKFPITRDFFGELIGQYRMARTKHIGPFENLELLEKAFPRGPANFSHWFGGLGFGFGF